MTTSSPTLPSYDEDLYSEPALRDPYGHYQRMRELGPVVWLPRAETYALARYADVRGALGDHAMFSSASGVAMNDAANDAQRGTMLASDPPLHDHLRKVVAHRLTPRALRARSAEVEAKAKDLVEGLLARGAFDAVPDLAQAMPASVVPDFLGFPERNRDKIGWWVREAGQSHGPNGNPRLAAGFVAGAEMYEFAHELATQRELTPGSVGADLLDAADRGEIEAQQCPMLMIDYLGPSIETTASALGFAVALLAQHEEQWRLLRRRPELIPATFNEVIRYESPIQSFSRLTTSGVVIDGEPLPAGSRVALLFGSANRDARKWERPDEFDITRDAADHVGLGYGIHACAGQGLARMEVHAVLRELVQHVDRIELAGEPVRSVNNAFRFLESLPVTLIPA